MLSITSSVALARALDQPIDPHLRALLALRLSQIDVPDMADVARFAVVQPGDGVADVEAELGSPLTYGGEPCHDWLLPHPGGTYEVAFDFGELVHVVVVQDRPGVDPAELDPLEGLSAFGSLRQGDLIDDSIDELLPHRCNPTDPESRWVRLNEAQ